MFSHGKTFPILKTSTLAAIAYSSILFAAASIQHFLLSTNVYDIGLFVQFSWLIGQGKISAISSLLNVSPLQDHFSLLLLPLGILYRIFPSPLTLIGLQSIALGSLTFLAAWIAWKRQIRPGLIWTLLIAIVLSPYPFLVNRGDFHPDVLTAPLMLIAIVEVTKARQGLYYVSLLLTLFAKNAQALFGFGLGAYSCLKGRYRRGLTTIAISLVWWFLATSLSSVHTDHVANRLGYLGDTNLEILGTLFTTPWVVFEVSPIEQIFLYTLGLCVPFLLLLRTQAWPALLGCLPVYLTNLIASRGIHRELDTHYSVAIFVFLIAGCLDSLPAISELSSKITRRLFWLTFAFSLAAFLGYSRLGYYQSRYWPRLAEAQEFHKVSEEIGDRESVLTVSNYAVHLADRDEIEQIERNKFKTFSSFDVIILPAGSAKTNYASGRLRLVKDSKLGKIVSGVLKGAESDGFKCSKFAKYVITCRSQ